MSKVLNGNIRKSPSIQLSLVKSELKDIKVERKISKGHVQLLECGNDTAVIIPYRAQCCYDLTASVE